MPSQPPEAPEHFANVFTLSHDTHEKPDREEAKEIKVLVERLRQYGINNISEANVEYAVRRTPQGDTQAAFRLLMLLGDTYEGIVRPYDPNIRLLGAVNRDAVTCYLDALLFAMFVRLDSFEAMLYDNFDDAKRKRLAALLRFWVNLLRSGQLITTDLTEQLQKAIAACGWADGARLEQQDPSEAFTFITGQLELPMLTLKMDMYHTGKEDPADDHKFINERLLEVALLDGPVDGKKEITLEDCLEHYFNNRIEVKRYLESQRRNTLKLESADAPTKMEKEASTHIEVVEVAETPSASTPITDFPSATTPSGGFPIYNTPLDKFRPSMVKKRTNSIFSQRKLELTGIDPEQLPNDDPNATVDYKLRKLSTARAEVLMPAWQFFKLLPWYTENMPTSDAQVAAHFAKKRPVLGICLKRYSYTNTGVARKLNTYVDIPLEILVPNFVSDEHIEEDGPLAGNFRLLLQAVLCHRGVSLHSGHYVCLARGRIAASQSDASPTEHRGSDESDFDDPWMRFDDLAKDRITRVDIHEALRKDTPYLLFYQVQPINERERSMSNPPSYTEATSRSQSDATPLEKPLSNLTMASDAIDLQQTRSEPKLGGLSIPEVNVADFVNGSDRTSLGATTTPTDEQLRGRVEANLEPRRSSITIDTSSNSGGARTEPPSAATTPGEERGNAVIPTAGKMGGSRRGSRVLQTRENSRSRHSSREDTKRLHLGMAKLTQMVSNKSDSGSVGSIAAAQQQPTSSGHISIAETTVPHDTARAPPVGHMSSRNPSKESVTSGKTTPKLRRSKSGSKRKPHEDRDCSVM